MSDDSRILKNFHCRNCGSGSYEPVYRPSSAHDIIGPGSPAKQVLYYVCSGCSSIFRFPEKFSATPIDKSGEENQEVEQSENSKLRDILTNKDLKTYSLPEESEGEEGLFEIKKSTLVLDPLDIFDPSKDKEALDVISKKIAENNIKKTSGEAEFLV
jgi:hypothetical protein